ncbi:amino acid permease [Aliikangiella sp. G2MR2-5]|uniref:amino acid permease n=1 Tax=Aliikangiella sp. G2MR2-5 TaxID=2788943 RepID=UPI0018A8F7BE|nr:amino acid permease [Aliikangiella sp. G2MR2-5]
MSEQTTGARNKKQIGLWIATALVVGNMIGSGIFLLPASLAPYGGVSIVGWLATTFGALMTALVFVRLCRRFPRQGGPYRYALENFGPLAGFMVTWSYWVSIWCGNAAISVATVSYASYFFPQLSSSPLLAISCSLALVWSITLLNTLGVRKAGIFQLVTTILKLLPLLIIGLAAFWVFDVSAFKPFNPSGESLPDAINATAALTLWAFLGLESATIPAENVRQPKKTIPRATLLGFLIAASVYIASQVSLMSVLPSDVMARSEAPFADVARVLWGDWAGSLIALGALISCIGALNGWILLQGQVPMTAARDNLMPSILKDTRIPGVSITALVFSSLLISFLVIANFSEGMVSLFTFAILISTLGIFIPYLLSVAASIRLTIMEWSEKRNYISLLFSVFALGYCLWAVAGVGVKAMQWGVVLLLAGLPIYWLVTRRS